MVIFKGVVAYREDETCLKLNLSFNLGANKEQKSEKSKIEYQFNGKQQEVAFEISNNYFSLFIIKYALHWSSLPFTNIKQAGKIIPFTNVKLTGKI